MAFFGVLCEFFGIFAVGEFLIFECDFAVEFAEFADGFEFHIHFGDCFDEGGTGEAECCFSFFLLDCELALFFAFELDAFLAFLLLAFLFGSLGEFFLAFLVKFFPAGVIDGVVEVKMRVAVFDDPTRSFVFGVV